MRAPMPIVSTPRMRVSTAEIDHFRAFITSPHLIQDQPLRKRAIMLSTKETIKVPKVIPMIIPERIVNQYMTYCQESRFTPLIISRATLLRIFSKCAKSVRTSVEALDYLSSAGGHAFYNLCDVVETLKGFRKRHGNIASGEFLLTVVWFVSKKSPISFKPVSCVFFGCSL